MSSGTQSYREEACLEELNLKTDSCGLAPASGLLKECLRLLHPLIIGNEEQTLELR